MDTLSPIAPFPAGFHWGAATAAFQIEGAHQADGRGPSIWDTFCATPGHIADGSDGSVACDHYHRWPGDLDIAQQLGLSAYRFSVSWARIQPAAGGAVNARGLDFYDRLVDGMLERGLAPFMTLYHWDLPQHLQDQGGWNARSTVDAFVDYARTVTRRLGDRVASIATFNEPFVTAYLGHWLGIFAPGLRDPQVAMNAAHHQLLAHGRALQALRADGVTAPMGIVCNMGPVEPLTRSAADQRAAERHDLLVNRFFLDALLTGAYPERLHALVGTAPAVHAGDLADIAAPLDFLGINYYYRFRVGEHGLATTLPPGAQATAMGWEVSHEGLTQHLTDIHHRYPQLPPVVITESGCACDDHLVAGQVHDSFRVDYLRGQIAALGRAIDRGVAVQGYFVWSLLDNFEWSLGYQKRFGLVHVDYPSQTRTVKASGQWYRDFITQQRQLARR